MAQKKAALELLVNSLKTATISSNIKPSFQSQNVIRAGVEVPKTPIDETPLCGLLPWNF